MAAGTRTTRRAVATTRQAPSGVGANKPAHSVTAYAAVFRYRTASSYEKLPGSAEPPAPAASAVGQATSPLSRTNVTGP